MTERIEVDKELCISSGTCVETYPAAFRFDDDELAETTDGAAELSGDDKRDAARLCPTGAILLYDEQGVEVDPF